MQNNIGLEPTEAKFMKDILWLVIMFLCCALLSGVGVYAWHRQKPMWFWIGNPVKKGEIADIAAYNHENGIMWAVYSLVFWAAVLVGIWNSAASLILIAAGCIVGLPLLAFVYKRIYRKYKVS